jgi:hypothetical protein
MRTPTLLSFGLAAALAIGVCGCAEKSEVKEETTVKTPDGTTTTTDTKTIEQKGKNPPGPMDTTPVVPSTTK